MNNSSLHDKVIWLTGMKSHLKETWIKILKLFYKPKEIFTGVKTAIPEKFGLTLCSCKQIYPKKMWSTFETKTWLFAGQSVVFSVYSSFLHQ